MAGGPPSLGLVEISRACLTAGSRGRTATQVLRRPGQPPFDIDPAFLNLATDLLTVYVTHPFPDAEANYDPSLGAC